MGKKKSYNINGLYFDSQSNLIKYLQIILKNNPLGEKIELKDFYFLMDLLKKHPEAETKIGQGVEYITTRKDSLYGTTIHFQIHRIDGTNTDFSFKRCIKPSTQSEKFKNAARISIDPYIKEFRNKHFRKNGEKAICPLSKDLIKWKKNHVDHIYPMTFDRILKDFIDLEKINVKEVEFTGIKEDNSISVEFESAVLKKKFIKYHNHVAKLRVLSAFGNLSIAKKNNN